MKNGTNSNGRIERRRVAVIIGETLMRVAEESTEFREKLKAALDATVTDEKQRRFLKKMGWLPSRGFGTA
jgi:hypothetical protein